MLRIFLSCLMLITGVSYALASEPEVVSKRGELLISAEKLVADFDGSRYRVLDTRDRAAYDKGHINGALLVDMVLWKKLSMQPFGLTDEKIWQQPLDELAITPETRVVVYGEMMPEVARLWWLLKYLGVKHVAILDGGYASWTKAGGQTSTVATSVKPIEHPIAFDTRRYADLDQLVEMCVNSQKAVLIDNRSEGEFSGKAGFGVRKGHVPGACHVEWVEFLDADGKFLPDEQLRAKLNEAKLAIDTPVIVHCQSGGRSSVGVFVIELLGYPSPANYYQGWAQYSTDASLPIEAK
ncbi:MAG: sulfurtransferase [Planctomycetaceae bacterium]|nr:sulfurtransferase [Planctomycetaceae bacterium]